MGSIVIGAIRHTFMTFFTTDYSSFKNNKSALNLRDCQNKQAPDLPQHGCVVDSLSINLKMPSFMILKH